MPSTKFRFILAKRFQRRRYFRNQQIRNKNCLWWPCLLMDRDEMSNVYRGPSIDASYQVGLGLCRSPFILLWRNLIQNLPTKFWFIWLSSFKGEDFFRNRPIRNKNCMWWPCLLTDRDEMSNFLWGHFIDASYQVSVVVMFANRSGRNEQSS